MKKGNKKLIAIIIISFFISIYGVIIISGNLPKFIKEKSGFKVNYSLKPFDFRFEVGEYSLYINSKVITNIKNSSGKIVVNMEKKISNSTSSMVNKTSSVFKYVEEKVSSTIQHKVK